MRWLRNRSCHYRRRLPLCHPEANEQLNRLSGRTEVASAWFQPCRRKHKPMQKSERTLVIIGGHEDRTSDKVILKEEASSMCSARVLFTSSMVPKSVIPTSRRKICERRCRSTT